MDDPKKKKNTVAKASAKAATTVLEASLRTGAAGPNVTPPRMAQPRMTHSARVLLTAMSAKVVVQDEKGRYALGDRAGAQRALEALGDKSWAAARMAELEDAVLDLNVLNPGHRQGFVV